MPVSVKDAPQRHRYVIEVDGEPAGFAEYHRREDVVEFHHTQVDDRFEGQGLGSQLAREALDDVRSAGLQVVPTCPFIRSWIDRHPDYRDLVVQRS